jgi:peptidoglycan hydrolase-like protein with peptidoglycan-binding domain
VEAAALSAPSVTLRQGSKGDEVVKLQSCLNYIMNAGLTVDGVFGAKTLAAVKNFQSKYGLSVDGVVGPATISKMNALLANSTTVTTTTTSTLRQGSTGSEVSKLQRCLNYIMGSGLSVDGKFGANTFTAVQNFQRSYGLSVDGVVGPATRSKINTAIPYLYISSATMRQGSSGSEVIKLQKYLNCIMNAGLTVDGKFGAKTLAAVKNFQSTYGLTVDGAVGPATKTKLNTLMHM